jgi:hypothetical protein
VGARSAGALCLLRRRELRLHGVAAFCKSGFRFCECAELQRHRIEEAIDQNKLRGSRPAWLAPDLNQFPPVIRAVQVCQRLAQGGNFFSNRLMSCAIGFLPRCDCRGAVRDSRATKSCTPRSAQKLANPPRCVNDWEVTSVTNSRYFLSGAQPPRSSWPGLRVLLREPRPGFGWLSYYTYRDCHLAPGKSGTPCSRPAGTPSTPRCFLPLAGGGRNAIGPGPEIRPPPVAQGGISNFDILTDTCDDETDSAAYKLGPQHCARFDP